MAPVNTKAEALNRLADMIDAVRSEVNGAIIDGVFGETDPFVDLLRVDLACCFMTIRDEEKELDG